MTNYNEIHACEVCNIHELFPVLNLNYYPMCGDLIEIKTNTFVKNILLKFYFLKNSIIL